MACRFASFEVVDVVIHSIPHRLGYLPDAPALEDTEPAITDPTCGFHTILLPH